MPETKLSKEAQRAQDAAAVGVDLKRPPKTDIAAFRRDLSGLSPKARYDAIIALPDAMRVVRALPVQDLYATVRDVGPADCLELIELLRPEQVQGFLDLDGWRHDRLDPVAIGDWLEVLFAANLNRAVTQLRGLDVELLSLLLKIHTRVYDLKAEEEPEEDVGLHSVSPDQHYLVVYDQGSGSEKLVRGLKAIVDNLFARDIPFILRLIEGVRWELPSSLEEEAYKWRNGRLADLGFLEPETAGEIFAWLDPDAVPAHVVAAPPPLDAADREEEPGTNLATSVLLPRNVFESGRTVVGTALVGLPDAIQERVRHELMMLANRLHLALGADLGDTGALVETIERATHTVGIGLSYLSKGDVARLGALVVEHPVATLFRVGHSLGLRIGRELRARLADHESGIDKNDLLRLDTPLREAVAGALKQRPLFYVGLVDAARAEFRPFASLAEVAETARAAAEAAFRAAFVGVRGLGATDQALLDAGLVDEADSPSHGMLVANAAVRQLLSRPLSFAPLEDDEVKELVARMLPGGHGKLLPGADKERARQALVAVAKGAAPLPGAPTPEAAEQRARAYVSQVLDAVEAELGAIVGAPDTTLLTTLWTRARIKAGADPTLPDVG